MNNRYINSPSHRRNNAERDFAIKVLAGVGLLVFLMLLGIGGFLRLEEEAPVTNDNPVQIYEVR